MSWQPIETAPMDGSVVIVGGYEPLYAGGDEWRSSHARYNSYGVWECGLVWVTPTHWMPLPEPPK
jgi:hypothetical protein